MFIYTPATKRALRICFEAHKDQLDKSGQSYVFHPFHLAEQMDTEQEICVALLHDVLEDTDLTAADLIDAGIPGAYVASVELLTRERGLAYDAYVRLLAKDPVARKVKLADLRHNSDLTRLDHEPTDIDLRRQQKYLAAISYLEQVEREDKTRTREDG